MMAIVLLAVQRLARETSPAMLNSAPRLLWIWAVIFPIIYAIPPLKRMMDSTPPASRVTMISSPMPVMPLPMAWNQAMKEKYPMPMPISPVARSPMVRTAMTWIPARAVTSTSR